MLSFLPLDATFRYEFIDIFVRTFALYKRAPNWWAMGKLIWTGQAEPSVRAAVDWQLSFKE